MKKEIICINDKELNNVSGGGRRTLATVGAVLGVCGSVFITGCGVCSIILDIKKTNRQLREHNE